MVNQNMLSRGFRDIGFDNTTLTYTADLNVADDVQPKHEPRRSTRIHFRSSSFHNLSTFAWTLLIQFVCRLHLLQI